MDLTVLIPALNEAGNLQSLLPDVARVLRGLPLRSEIIVIDGGSGEDTRRVVEEVGGRCIRQASQGYGGALSEGFAAAAGDYVLTMDGDLSHDPAFIERLWEDREDTDLLIASRYVAGGSADSGVFRSLLSRVLNNVYRRFLRLPFRDLSSGFRLYRMAALRSVAPSGRDFDFLPEVLVLMYVAGLRIEEIPFHYRPRRNGHSRVKLFRFGWGYLTTLFRMRRLPKPEREAHRRRRLERLREGSEVP